MDAVPHEWLRYATTRIQQLIPPTHSLLTNNSYEQKNYEHTATYVGSTYEIVLYLLHPSHPRDVIT